MRLLLTGSLLCWLAQAAEKPLDSGREKPAPEEKEAPRPELLSADDLKLGLMLVNREVSNARSVCKPNKGIVGPEDTENGCTEAFAKAEKRFRSLPPEAKQAMDYPPLSVRFDELVEMKKERLLRAEEWDQLAARKALGKAEPFEKLKVLLPLSIKEWEDYENPQCPFKDAQSLVETMRHLRALRASAKLTRFCQTIKGKKRPAEQELYCRVQKSPEARDATVFEGCLRRHVADWGSRRIQGDLRALTSGQFLTEERARKTGASLESALVERLAPWTDAARTLGLEWAKSDVLSRVRELHQAFQKAFAERAGRACVEPEEVSAMDARARGLDRQVATGGARLLRTHLAKKMVFEENASREVIGRYQKAWAVYSRNGDTHCWVASATYHSRHFGSDRWSPWAFTYDGAFLDARGQWVSVVPCRCK